MIDSLRWELLVFLLLGATVLILALRQRYWKQNALRLEWELNELKRHQTSGVLLLSTRHISRDDQQYLRAQAALARRAQPWQANAAAGPESLWLQVPRNLEALQARAESEAPGEQTPYSRSLSLARALRHARSRGYGYLCFTPSVAPAYGEDLELFEE